MNTEPSARPLPTAGARSVIAYVPGKPLAELEREFGIHDGVKLASNENPLGPSPVAMRAVASAIGELALYPDSHGYRLKRRLAEHIQVAPDRIVLGNGSNELFQLLVRGYVQPGEGVVYSQYAFVAFSVVSRAASARCLVTPARDWGCDLDAMRDATKHAKLVFIANPNNPTGTWVGADALRQFMAAVPPEVLVVIDEAYAEYVDEPDYSSCVAWVGYYPNLVVTRTFSKIHGLAGVRLGYAVAQPEVCEILNRVREPFNVNHLAMVAAEAALGDDDHLQRSLQNNRQGRARLLAELAASGFDCLPGCGNFVTVDCRVDAVPIFQALLRRGVIVRTLHEYAMPRHLRVTVGTPGQLDRFLEAFRKVTIRGAEC